MLPLLDQCGILHHGVNESSTSSLDFDVLSQIGNVGRRHVMCEECMPPLVAESYCRDCSISLCVACTRHHRRSRSTCKHEIGALVERSRGSLHEVVTDLQGQVVKAQMRQGQIATVIEMVEECAKTARTDVERTFDDLLCA